MIGKYIKLSQALEILNNCRKYSDDEKNDRKYAKGK